MKVILIDVKTDLKGTKSFFWKTDKTIKFLPGQYIYLTLPKLDFPDSRGATRQFTISSSPTESEFIRITTRIRKESGFKQTLVNMEKGMICEIAGPNGTYILDTKQKNPQVFIVGGIGITPARSIIKYDIDNKIKNKIVLLYSCSDENDITFKSEFESWTKKYDNLKLHITVTHPSPKWKGSKGRIDADTIKKLSTDFALLESTYWISGPPQFVTAMEDNLESLGVNNSKINVDKFTGY